MTVNKLIMKIHEYDEASGSLVVSFKSDNSVKSIDDYPRMAYQPTIFEESDVEAVIKKIAITGVSVAEAQDKQDSFKLNETEVSLFKSKVGQEITYDVSDLIPPPPPESASDINLNI